MLEGQAVAAIVKGGAGEVQRNPLKPCRVAWVRAGETGEEDWPALLPGVAHKWREEPLDPERAPRCLKRRRLSSMARGRACSPCSPLSRAIRASTLSRSRP